MNTIQMLRQGIQEQQQLNSSHQPVRKGKVEQTHHSSIDMYRNKQTHSSSNILHSPDKFDKKIFLQHSTSQLGKSKNFQQQLLNRQSNLLLAQQPQSAPFPTSAQSRSQKRKNFPSNQAQSIDQSPNTIQKAKRFQDSSFSDGETDQNAIFFNQQERQTFRDKVSFSDRAELFQQNKYQQPQYIRGLSQQIDLEKLIEKQSSRNLPSPSSNSLYLRNSSSSLTKQQQQQHHHPSSPKEQLIQQSKGVINNPHCFNLSLPPSNSNLQKNNNNSNNASFTKQDSIINTKNNYINLNACKSPTIHDAEPGIQAEKWNSFNGSDIYGGNLADNSELNQLGSLDALQLENNLLIRDLLSTINNQKQYQHSTHATQPYFNTSSHSLNNNNTTTNNFAGNSSFYEKPSNPVAAACSLPNSPHIFPAQSHAAHKNFLASSNHSSVPSSNDEKFIDFQNQLNELSRQLNQSNRATKKPQSAQQKAQQIASEDSSVLNRKKEQKCAQFSNISISKLAQQNPYQHLHSQRAYLLEQTMQRKAQQQEKQQAPKGVASAEEIDFLNQKRPNTSDQFLDEDKTFESELSKSKPQQQQFSQHEQSTLMPSESSKKLHSPPSKSPLERSSSSNYKFRELDDPSSSQLQRQSQELNNLETKLKTILEEKKDIQLSLHSSQEDNDKLATENRKLKQEITRLEGIITQKESFELERQKQTGIIQTQQQIMLSNYEAIKLQSADALSKYQTLSSELKDMERQCQSLQIQLKEKDAQMESILRETKLTGQGIERSNESAIIQAAFPFSINHNNSHNNHFEDDYQQIIKLKNEIEKLKEELQSKDQEVQRQAEELNQKIQEIQKKDEQLRSAIELKENLTVQIKQLELIKSSGGIEQQKMKQQIQISQATIHLLNQEIESYKTELIQVQQLCSISEVPQRQTASKQQQRLPGGAAAKPDEIEGFQQQQNQQQQAVAQQISLEEQYQRLQLSYQELKAKEMEYEKSINDLKMVFQEENKVRKNLETEIIQLKAPFTFQKNMSLNGGTKKEKESEYGLNGKGWRMGYCSFVCVVWKVFMKC